MMCKMYTWSFSFGLCCENQDSYSSSATNPDYFPQITITDTGLINNNLQGHKIMTIHIQQH